MSTTTVVPYIRPGPPERIVQRRPGRSVAAVLIGALNTVLGWPDRSRQRKALAELAEDKHLLKDIGLTREQALYEAGKPFWH